MYLLSWNVLLNIKDYFFLNVLCKSAGLEENQDNITRRTNDYSQRQSASTVLLWSEAQNFYSTGTVI